jgi:predicted RNase H-like HicB family nuclease
MMATTIIQLMAKPPKRAVSLAHFRRFLDPVDSPKAIAQNDPMVTFRIEPDGKEFHAWSPELPGTHTHGATRAAALKNLKDAVRLYLDDVMEEALMPESKKPSTRAAKARKRA